MKVGVTVAATCVKTVWTAAREQISENLGEKIAGTLIEEASTPDTVLKIVSIATGVINLINAGLEMGYLYRERKRSGDRVQL